MIEQHRGRRIDALDQGSAVIPARGEMRPQLASCVIGLLMCVLALSPGVAAQDEVSQQERQQSRFLRTVYALQDATPDERGDFAAVALSRLAQAYSAEARLARQNDRAGDARGWTATVEQYASQIDMLLDDVALGLPVRLTVEGDESLAITVGDRTVIVGHPRLSQQGALEQAILKDFCAGQDCTEIQPDRASLQPIAAAEVRIRPNWSFTERGSNCSYNGITVRFSNDQNTAHARHICEQFLQEVMLLADELAEQQRHLVGIVWEQLAIQAVPDSPDHLVRLNPLGDTLLVTTPLLYANPGLLQQVLPWLRQWLENSTQTTVEIEAALYGWQKP